MDSRVPVQYCAGVLGARNIPETNGNRVQLAHSGNSVPPSTENASSPVFDRNINVKYDWLVHR